MKNKTGACKFLNVLQGENHADAEDWYQQMKDYCDSKISQHVLMVGQWVDKICVIYIWR